MTLSAGRYEQRVRIERQAAGPIDAFGNPMPATWSEVITVWAAFRPQFGREQVEAGRLESTVKGVVTIRHSKAAALITPADRIVFLRAPYKDRAAQIRSIAPMSDRREIELTVELGVAQ